MSSRPGEIPAGATLRTPTTEDAAAISALCNAVTRDLYDSPDVGEDEVRSWFSIADLESFIAERGGEAVGYADVRRDEDGARFPIDIRIAPHARGDGIGAALLEAAETWGRGHAKPGAVARGFAAERDTEVAETLAAAGFRAVRHFFTMEIDLPERLDEPEWPAGIRLRTYDPKRDEDAVCACVDDAFSESWDYRPIERGRWRELWLDRPSFEPELWWLAEDGGELAAVSLNAWHWSGDPTFGWIGTLCVRRPWRRRGLALALLRHSFADFERRGATRVALGVDTENETGAVGLYERAGMRPVRRNDTYEREL